MFVPGRGCVNRGGGVRLLELLAAYGVAGVSFDKRGVGQSQGNCRFGTIEEFTGDVLGAYDALRARDLYLVAGCAAASPPAATEAEPHSG